MRTAGVRLKAEKAPAGFTWHRLDPEIHAPVRFSIAVSSWAARQPVSRAGFGRRFGLLIAGWTVLWAAVVIPGSIWFHGNPVWWIPGALITALPALVIYSREPS